MGLALAGVYLLVSLISACAPIGQSGGQGGTTTPTIPSFTPQPFQTPDISHKPGSIAGAAAIKPHLSGVPAFTTQDMADYAKGHLPGGASGSGFTIVRNEFLPSQDASGLLGSQLASAVGFTRALGGAARRLDGALVGFLEAQGAFAFPGGVPDSGQTYPYAFEVFDGKTGNLLMYGGLNQPAPNQPPTPTPTPRPTQAPNPPKLSVSASSFERLLPQWPVPDDHGQKHRRRDAHPVGDAELLRDHADAIERQLGRGRLAVRDRGRVRSSAHRIHHLHQQWWQRHRDVYVQLTPGRRGENIQSAG